MKHRSLFGLYLLTLMLLFQVPALVEATPPAVQEPDLRLVGTAVSSDPTRSLAVIENRSSGTQRAVTEGDRLGEMLIRKILSGKVVIETSSGEMVLTMGSFARAGSPGPSAQTGQLEAEEVDAALPDYKALMRQIRVRSRFEGGRSAGFVIYNIGPGSIFARMGLKDGDVIVSVNGKSFATTQPAVEFYEAITEYETVSLEIMRDDQSKQLLFEVR